MKLLMQKLKLSLTTLKRLAKMFTVAEMEIMCDEILMAGHGLSAQELHALPENEIIKLYTACDRKDE